ncbi:MAG: hypothetical protein Aseana_21160 [Candidatus Pelagadaptatus aseana]
MGLVILTCAVWFISRPASYHQIGEQRTIGPIPEELLKADIGDVIAAEMVTIAEDVPGHDEVLHIPGTNKLLVSARDEWIWEVDTASGKARKLVYSPVSPTGAKMVPGSTHLAYFCMARLDYNHYPHGPGLYLLDISKAKFEPVVTRVPITGELREDGLELPNSDEPNTAKVYPAPLNETVLTALDNHNSRPMQFCNDLDISSDGRHVYMSEPFSHPKASSGLGALPEAITLARNGRIWRYDTKAQTVGLVVENAIFADGVLIEYDPQGREQSLLITETVNFLISRAHLSGNRAGQYDTLWDNLPGLPDGMDRDSEGRVWVGFIKDRSPLMTWMHANPWIKPLLLRIPSKWLAGSSSGTGFMVMSRNASEIIAYSHHSGEKVRDLSVVIPVEDKLFLSSFFERNKGVHFVPIGSILEH